MPKITCFCAFNEVKVNKQFYNLTIIFRENSKLSCIYLSMLRETSFLLGYVFLDKIFFIKALSSCALNDFLKENRKKSKF